MTVVGFASRPYRPRARRDVQTRRFRIFAALFILGACIALRFTTPDVRYVLAPALAVAVAALFYLAVQIRREGNLPIFEIATFFVLAASVYSIVPLLQYVLSGMEWGPWADNRLYKWEPTAREFGGFAWRHVVLITTFVLVYLPLRGRRPRPMEPVAPPTRTMVAVVIAVLVCLILWDQAVRLYMGPATSVYEGGTGTPMRTAPHIVMQLSNIFQAIRLNLKQCLMLVLLMRWNRRSSRHLLIGWLFLELAVTVGAFESRSTTVLLLLTVAVGYHRLVRPIRVGSAFVFGGILLAAFLIFGLLRDFGPQEVTDRREVWGSSTEFQVLYGTAYDVYRRRLEGTLPEVPPQLYFIDFYRLVPSQLLPFYKWEPSIWYMDKVFAYPGYNASFMFGVITQSVVGFGYGELIVRSILLAMFYAWAHRWYCRNSRSFWITFAYLYVLTWAFYAIRSTSFEIVYRMVYYLTPTFVIVKVLTALVTKVRSTRQSLAGS